MSTMYESKDVVVKDVKLNKHDRAFGPNLRYYNLDITYAWSDEDGNKHETTITNVELPLEDRAPNVIVDDLNVNSKCIDVGFGYVKAFTYWADKIVERATKEMTLEEIEKKLGHKVKIIG